MPLTEEIHEGDVGTIFIATIKDSGTAVDVSGATDKELLFKPPTGSLKTQTAVFTNTGTDGKIQYVTDAATDLDENGEWELQGRIDGWKTQVVNFIVHRNLS